jgi:hypothetical protein
VETFPHRPWHTQLKPCFAIMGWKFPAAVTRATLPESEAKTPLLSLRRIAPEGFLIQNFAVNSSGCKS